MNVGRFAYKIEVDMPKLKSIRLHNLSHFACTCLSRKYFTKIDEHHCQTSFSEREVERDVERNITQQQLYSKPQASQAQNTWCMGQLVYIENCMGKSPIVKQN